MRPLVWLLVAFVLVVPSVQADLGHSTRFPVTSASRDVGAINMDDAPPAWRLPSNWKPSGPVWESASSDDAPNQLAFACPDVQASIYTAPGCPAFIFDPEDIMSQPVLVIEQTAPNLVAFHALHGGRGLQSIPGDETPSERSRSDSIHQPHTLFQSKDGGRTWVDRRYYSPWNCEGVNPDLPCPEQSTPSAANQVLDQVSGSQTRRLRVWGEENAVTLDALGKVYVGALYAVEDSNLGPGLHYRVATWKGERLNRDMEYNVNRVILDTAQDNNRIESMSLAYAAGTDSVVLLWREQAVNPDPATGLDSWIQVHYSKPGKGARWMPLEGANRFGPCSTISNAVAMEDGNVYVACKRELARTTSTAANLTGYRLVKIDTHSWNVTDAGPLPLVRGERPYLADTRQSHIVAGVAGIDPGTNQPFADIAYGIPGQAWIGPFPFQQLSNQTSPIPRANARITSIAFREDTGHLYVLYQERYNLDPTDASSSAREYYKSLGNIAVRGTQLEFLGKLNLQMGDPQTRINYAPTFQGEGQGVFDDLYDGMVVTRDAQDQIHVWVAYGDFGQIRFAELTEEEPILAAGFPFPPTIPPIPLAAAGVNPALVGALAGTLSMAMVLRMLAAKKKATVEAPTL